MNVDTDAEGKIRSVHSVLADAKLARLFSGRRPS